MEDESSHCSLLIAHFHAILESMVVTQTVDIPADRLITLEVLREVPPGRTILTFTPAPVMPAFNPEKAREAIKNCTGLAKRMGINLSSDEFLEMRHRDRDIELAKDREFLSSFRNDN
jgi:hypothetical protein